MSWFIIVHLILTLHFNEGFEGRKQTSNLQPLSFKCYFGNCGGHSSLSTKNRSDEFTSIRCFRCHNCYYVTKHTMKVECPSPSCCYTAHVKNHTHGSLYVIRGCGRWDRVNGCRMTCTEVQSDHLWKHPGVFIKCITCNEGDSNECNGQYSELFINATNPPPAVMCYRCRKCNQITVNTLKVKCPFAQCCYTVLVSDQPNEGTFAVRGCISSNEPCLETCNQKKRQHLQAHTNGTFNYCKTCNVGDSDVCNRNNYSLPKRLTNASNPTAVRCYECRNCNKVFNTTPTVRCPYPKCCYIALLKDFSNGHIYVVRGCRRGSENCSITCSSLEKDPFQAYYEGKLRFCITCREGDGDQCNGNNYKPLTTIMKSLNGTSVETHCFSCENCNNVTINTAKVACASSCCYSINVQGITERGCVRYLSGRCEEYCLKQKNTFCNSCSGSNCNIQKISRDTREFHTVFKRTSHIHCYKCVGCYFISNELHQTEACPDGCCVIIWWTTHNESTMMRKCVNLNGMRCQDYCADAKQVLNSQDPKGVVHYCEGCTIDKCNYIKLHQSQSIERKHRHINCYQCDDCKETSVTVKTAICITDCCYSAVLQIPGESSRVRRACAKIRSGYSCHNYCEYVEAEFRKENLTGAAANCTSCQTDKCNTDKSKILTEIHKHVELIDSNTSDRVEIHGMKNRVAKLQQRIGHARINCYKCRNCQKITANIPCVLCDDRCCYTTKLEYDNGTVIIERDCLKIEPGRTCNQFCTDFRIKHIRANPIGSVDFTCNICTSEKCNHCNFHADVPLLKLTPIPIYNPIKCYNCFGCYTINQNTDQIECPDNCCYTAIWTEYGRIMMARLCALLDGKKCANVCSWLTQRLNANMQIGVLHHCSTCCSQKCNSENFPKPQNVATKGISKSKCYTCKNCEKISISTRSMDCESSCCYSALSLENDGTRNVVKHCANIFPGTPCNKFCSHVQKLHQQSNPLGAVIYCKVCITDRCNNETTDTDETAVANTDPIKCFDCDDCYSITNETSIQCTTGCCITVVWTLFGKTYIRRDCLKLKETPCSKYCENAERIIKFRDPSGQIHDCDVCKNNDCNRLKANSPHSITPVPFSCYSCTECDELTLDDSKHITCYSYCCFVIVKRLTNASPYISQRGCPHVSPHIKCSDYCEKVNKTLVDQDQIMYNCTVCSKDRCNHDNMEEQVKKANDMIE